MPGIPKPALHDSDEKYPDRVILTPFSASADETARLPLGFQKIYVRSLEEKCVADTLLVHNNKYGSIETAKGSSKPISKIVELDALYPGESTGA